MLPTLDEFNEVFDSLLKGGTRYRTEKIAVVVMYGIIVLVSFLWVVTGIELGSDLRGTFRSEGVSDLQGTSFLLTNTGATAWHDVRVVLNDRYLAKFEKLGAEKQERIDPDEFRYYYYVPRPWGHPVWERLAGRAKPSSTVPQDVEIESVRVKSREGAVRIERGGQG